MVRGRLQFGVRGLPIRIQAGGDSDRLRSWHFAGFHHESDGRFFVVSKAKKQNTPKKLEDENRKSQETQNTAEKLEDEDKKEQNEQTKPRNTRSEREKAEQTQNQAEEDESEELADELVRAFHSAPKIGEKPGKGIHC